MYESHYGFTETPFSILPDPTFLYLSKRHALAYATLQYGVDHRAGFTLITGDIGSGKTTLIRHLLNQIDEDINVGLISNTRIDADELLRWVLLAFDQPYDAPSRVQLFDQFQQYLIDQYAARRRVVLIIDEAQNFAPQTLEELRMLSNINADHHQLLQIVMAGQPRFREVMRQPDLVQLSQRVAADFHIPPLPRDEVSNYIAHRLTIAGRTEPLFDDEAIARIAISARGVPRTINLLCDTALVYGFSAGTQCINATLVEEVIADKRQFGSLPLPAEHACVSVVNETAHRIERSDSADIGRYGNAGHEA